MFVVGINGGHIRSTISVWSKDQDCEVYREHGECLNLHVIPKPRIVNRATTLLERAAKSLGMEKRIDLAKSTAALTVAFPGAFRETDRDEADESLKAFGKGFEQAFHVDDTLAGLFAGVPQKKGVCVFSGAGASIGIANGELLRKLDGRGPIIGDFGSGFQLVMLFLNRLGRQIDLGLDSALLNRVRQFCSDHNSPLIPPEPDAEQLQGWFDELVTSFASDWRQQFPSLAEPLLNPSNNKEMNELLPIVTRCTRDLAKSFRIASCIQRKLGLWGAPIVLQGSLLRKSEIFRRHFIKYTRLPQSNFIVSELSPVDGALLLAADRAFGSQYASEMHAKLVSRNRNCGPCL